MHKHPGFHRRRQTQLAQVKTAPSITGFDGFGFLADGPVIGETHRRTTSPLFEPHEAEAVSAYLLASTRKNGKRTISVASAVQCLRVAAANRAEARKVDANQIATYHGVRYHFPDSLPGETVFFENGLPVSSTGVAIPCDNFGFDELQSNTSALVGHVHSPHRTDRPSQSNAVHSDSLNRRDDRVPDRANSHPAPLQVLQSARTLRRGDDDAGRGHATPFLDAALPSASGDGNADKHK